MLMRWGAGVWLALAVAFAALPGSVRAQADAPSAAHQALAEVLGLEELLAVMREEGLQYGEGIGEEFLPGGGGSSWASVVARIYDTQKMRASVEAGFKREIAPEHLAPLNAFFSSDTGRRIVEKEIEARAVFLDPAAEAAAREAYLQAEAATEAGEDPVTAKRLELLRAYVAANDLVEFNVAGALTANLRFYQGLTEGGGWETDEGEMLAQVWAQEEEIRADTTEWLMSYLLLAYATLSDEEIAGYVALSERPEGQALNRALFAGFDAMYSDISYALGLALAVQMQGEDL